MPKITYKQRSRQMKPDWQEVIAQANSIIEEYVDKGYDLTIRQLYYQFISRDVFPEDWFDSQVGSFNSQRNYKRLVDVIGEGRLCGLVDWTYLVDRTRNLQTLDHWDGPEDILHDAARWFNQDLWDEQQVRVEVWIEKDALLGLIQNVCSSNDVPYFSCRGYTSLSEMWTSGQRIVQRLKNKDQGTTILHLGDHDPSGVDMSRDIEDRLLTFLSKHVTEQQAESFEVKRIALTYEQVQTYNPPPNPVKQSDTRWQAYVDKLGLEECWELDALGPDQLTTLIQDNISSLRDADLWNKGLERENRVREQIETVADKWFEIEEYLDI